MKKHMQDVIKLIQEGGRRKIEPDLEIANKLRKLERMKSSDEPTSIPDFYDQMKD